jgi:hypothetical protein
VDAAILSARWHAVLTKGRRTEQAGFRYEPVWTSPAHGMPRTATARGWLQEIFGSIVGREQSFHPGRRQGPVPSTPEHSGSSLRRSPGVVPASQTGSS